MKICGLTDPAAVKAAVEAGADAVGFVFAESPRQVTADQAASLAAAVPATLKRVAVMLHPSPEEWTTVQHIFKPDWLQTDAEDFEALDIDDGVLPLPVYRDHMEFVAAAIDWPQRVMFEGVQSGSGQRADWQHAADVAARSEMILAGGLDPDSVADAIAAVGPWGVDVSSGVERRPGVKDPDKIAAFVRAAREVGQEQGNATE